MARKRARRRLSADQIELVVDRIMLCQARRLEAAMREDVTARDAEEANLHRLRDELAPEDRETVDERAMVRMQLQGRHESVRRAAVARRRLVNGIDDIIDAISVLSPKVLKGREWHYTDPRDEELIAALFGFLHRFDLMSMLNEKRDRYFAAHHARLATFPSERFYEHLDELGREQEAARERILEPEDHDWVSDTLRRENVNLGERSLPVRAKDVAKAMKVSESAQRVRKHRRVAKRSPR